MSEVAASLSQPGLGERLLELLQARIPAAGGSLTISSKALAEELGVKQTAVTYQLHRLVREGRIATTAAGPRGVTIRLGGGAAARGAVRGRARGGARARKTASYCPWCGRRADDPTWHFCPTCGKELP